MKEYNQSLRTKISKLTLQATVGIGFITLIGVLGYWYFSSESAHKTTYEHLVANIEKQRNELLPIFLVPEQRAALGLVLEKIKKNEKLDEIKFSKQAPDCVFDKNNICSQSNSSMVTIFTPIRIGDETFGYIAKSKRSEPMFSSSKVFWVLFVTLLTLFALSLLLLHLFKRLTAKEIPNALDELVLWIEKWLRGANSKEKPKFAFLELEILCQKIKEVFEKHDKKRNQAIAGQISSGIVHDIRTDLQSLKSAYDLVEEVGDDTEKRIKRLENLNSVVAKRLPALVHLIESTLDASREIKLNQQFKDLRETIAQSVEDMEEDLKSSGISVSYHGTENEAVAYHDPIQIKRVLRNLLKNSVQAITESHSEKKLVDIAISREESEIRVFIEDTGPGISISKDKLFKAFETAKSTGTGLGLFNANKIINAHGGRIKSLKPRLLNGSCFEISLPKGENFAAP